MKDQVWSLYIIRCKDNSLYTGITIDVDRRFDEHQNDKLKKAKYLRGKSPLQLVFQAKIGNKSLASKAELKVKKLAKPEKEKLISGEKAIKSITNKLCNKDLFS